MCPLHKPSSSPSGEKQFWVTLYLSLPAVCRCHGGSSRLHPACSNPPNRNQEIALTPDTQTLTNSCSCFLFLAFSHVFLLSIFYSIYHYCYSTPCPMFISNCCTWITPGFKRCARERHLKRRRGSVEAWCTAYRVPVRVLSRRLS